MPSFNQDFDLPHSTEDPSVEKLIPRSAIKFSAITSAHVSDVALHVTDIIWSVHLNQESIRVIELE
jgi:hypothetical protein